MVSSRPSQFFGGALTPEQCKTMEALAERWHRVVRDKAGVVEASFYEGNSEVKAIIDTKGNLLEGSTCQPPLRKNEPKQPSPREELQQFLDTLAAKSS